MKAPLSRPVGNTTVNKLCTCENALIYNKTANGKADFISSSLQQQRKKKSRKMCIALKCICNTYDCVVGIDSPIFQFFQCCQVMTKQTTEVD